MKVRMLFPLEYSSRIKRKMYSSDYNCKKYKTKNRHCWRFFLKTKVSNESYFSSLIIIKPIL